MKTILSIDGGGIRGIIPARFLAALEAKAGPCCKIFDLITGTSTGGILAVGLAKPGSVPTLPAYKASELVDLYQQKGQAIFNRPLSYEIESGDELLGPKYPAVGIEAVLKQYFGDTKLGDALTPTMLTSYDTQAPGPRFFKSWYYTDSAVLMRDAARATSAAPTYFTPLKLGDEVLIDGGVFANNPAMCAWVEARKLFKDEDIMIVSVGTGSSEKKEDPSGWGLMKWAPVLVDIFMDGSSDTVDYQMNEMSDRVRYYRFQTDLGGVAKNMDDTNPATLTALLGLADAMVTKNAKLLGVLATLLKPKT